MANLSALSNITTTATALSNLILVTPQTTSGYQPQNAPNSDGTPSTGTPPPSILFDYEGEQTAVFESDITDHYIEDNTAIQDQVALKPVLITTEGYIGELNDVTPGALALLKTAADKLTVIDSYTPALSETALIAYNEAFLAYQVATNAIQAGVSSWNSLSGQSGGESVINGEGITIQNSQNKQQQAFQNFYGYWASRTLFTVQTPWAIFQNMAILRVQAVQGEETRVISSFKVTFKQIRTAQTATSIGVSQTFQGRAQAQAAGLTDLGTASPVSSISLTSGLQNMGVA